MNDTIVFIPALLRNSAFQYDLLRKLNGETLIQRAVNKAREVTESDELIFVFTDSEVIALSAERTGANVYVDSKLGGTSHENLVRLYEHLVELTGPVKYLLLLSPYAPLLSISILDKARTTLEEDDADAVAMKHQMHNPTASGTSMTLKQELCPPLNSEISVRSTALTLFRVSAINQGMDDVLKVRYLEGGENVFEVHSYRDWWVCEKLLQRKRIVFRVIGNPKVGMGHIYRALSLAHEITDHEVIFATDKGNQAAVTNLTNYDYRLEIFEPEDIVSGIQDLHPDIVVNDILNTHIGDVVPLQNAGAAVINFEDLGDGARIADVTINELYDEPQFSGDNIYWGNRYFFVRDEFADATPCEFKETGDSVLLTFGGIDRNNMTKRILFSINEACAIRNIYIYVVTGPGYEAYEELVEETRGIPNVSLTHATGVISKIMEKVSLAITSNGRTVYEMAHMNIPAIVIPQHNRERTHGFACELNGFVALEPYRENITERQVLIALERLLDEPEYRRALYGRTTQFRFDKNKQRVISLIENEFLNTEAS